MNKIARIVTLKCSTVMMRNVLGRISLCDSEGERKLARLSVRNRNFSATVEAFSKVDFRNVKNGLSPSDYKNIAFQLGQAYGLIQGKEFYTKQEIANAYPELRSFLMRDPSAVEQLHQLNTYRDKIVKKIGQATLSQHPEFPLLHISCPSYDKVYNLPFQSTNDNDDEANFFCFQSRGIVLETKHPGNCINFPFMHTFEYVKSSWPQDSLNSLDLQKACRQHKMELKSTCFISIFIWDSHMLFCDEYGWDSPAVQEAREVAKQLAELKNLSFDDFWHMFALAQGASENNKIPTLILVGLRDKVTYDLILEADALSVEAKKAGLLFSQL